MPTRSEMMYFAVGLSIGGMVGANWSKIKPIMEQFLGPAASGMGDAYGDIARMFADGFESFQDNAAERRHQTKAKTAKAKAKTGRAAAEDRGVAEEVAWPDFSSLREAARNPGRVKAEPAHTANTRRPKRTRKATTRTERAYAHG